VKPPQHIVRNTNMQSSLLSKSRSSNCPPYKSRTQCILLICIVLTLTSSFLIFFQRERRVQESEYQNPSSILRQDLTFTVKRIKHLNRDCGDKLLLLCCFTTQEILHKMLNIEIRWHKMELYHPLKL